MRTNIVLDDTLMEEAMRYARARTKKGLLEEALKKFIETRSAEERLATYQTRLADIRHKTAKLRLRTSAQDIVRADRDERE
jgi:Arc/MetJ family transcription regulator